MVLMDVILFIPIWCSLLAVLRSSGSIASCTARQSTFTIAEFHHYFLDLLEGLE